MSAILHSDDWVIFVAGQSLKVFSKNTGLVPKAREKIRVDPLNPRPPRCYCVALAPEEKKLPNLSALKCIYHIVTRRFIGGV